MGKKPDIVVWSEQRGYYAKQLPYATDLSAPVIKPEDVTSWKQSGVAKANHRLGSRFEDLKQEYNRLVEEYTWNEVLYKAKYSFEPVIGKTYHLYSDGGGLFLSLISPEEWRTAPDFLGSFSLDSDNLWKKVNDEPQP